MEGRRARLRAHLLAEIRTAALEELRRSGATALSLREVARAAGISPSGLYRYVDGRQGLLELLISDGFTSFGEAIASAIDAAGHDPVSRMEAVAISYRRWALDNPDQFGLILGTTVPGFHARIDGPTNASVLRFAEPMIRVIADVYAAGHPAGAVGEREGDPLAHFDPMTGGLPESLNSVVVRSWARVHGLVVLETFGHLIWSGTDVEELLRIEARSIATELGCDVVDTTARTRA